MMFLATRSHGLRGNVRQPAALVIYSPIPKGGEVICENECLEMSG